MNNLIPASQCPSTLMISGLDLESNEKRIKNYTFLSFPPPCLLSPSMKIARGERVGGAESRRWGQVKWVLGTAATESSHILGFTSHVEDSGLTYEH